MPDTYVTLAQAGNLSQAILDAKVIQTVLNFSPVLAGGVNIPGGAMPVALPFTTIADRTLTIVRESTEPVVDWYDAGEAVSGQEATTTQVSFTVRGLKARISVPTEVEDGTSRYVDQVVSQLRMQLKGMVKALMDAFYYGDNTANSKKPSGLHVLASTASPDMTIAQGSGTSAVALSLANIDDLLVSRMKEGTDMLVCTRALYKQFAKALRDTATQIAGGLQYTLQDWGKPALTVGGVPIYPDDFLATYEDVASGDYNGRNTATTDDGSSLFALKFGEDHLSAASFAQPGPLVSLLKGPTQDYDGHILWVRWFVSFVLRSPYSIGRIAGIDHTAAITA